MPPTPRRKTNPVTPIEANDLVRRRMLWPLKDAAYRLGISRATLYRRIDAGDLAVVRDGGRVFVTDKEIERYVARLEAAAS